MKIVIIHGQNHKGTSYHIGRALAERLETEENITEFFLPKDMPHFCCGCYNCLKDEALCPHNASMAPIRRSLDEADLLVFTTPVYCLRTTASMKALLDHLFLQWISHRPKEEMYFKRAVIVAVGAGAGMKKAAADIKTSLSYWGISDITVYGQRSLAEGWDVVSDKIKAEIETKTEKIALKLSRKKVRPRVSLGRRFMFMVMRSMQLKDWGAGPIDKAYWEEKGWLGKNRPWKKSL